MDHRTLDVDYVLEHLYRARQDVAARPEWFEPDAPERIDKAIACAQEARARAKAA